MSFSLVKMALDTYWAPGAWRCLLSSLTYSFIPDISIARRYRNIRFYITHIYIYITQRRSRLQHCYCVGVNKPKRYRQLRTKDLPKGPCVAARVGFKPSLPLSHQAPYYVVLSQTDMMKFFLAHYWRVCSKMWHKGPKPVVFRELFTEVQAKIGERGFQVSSSSIQLVSVNLS